MRRVIRLAGRAAVAVSLAFLAFAMISSARSFPSAEWGGDAILSALLGVALVALAMIGGAVGWAVLLRGGAPGVSLYEGVMAVGRSQVAKYLPGNVFHYVGRVASVQRLGAPVSAAVAALIGEAVLMVAAGMLVGLIGRSGDIGRLGEAGIDFRARLAMVVVVGGIVVLVGGAFLLLSSRIRSVLTNLRAGFRWTDFVCAGLLYGASQVLLGFALLVLLHGLFEPTTGIPAGQTLSASAIAWVAGFLTPGSPGGLGVREAVFVAVAGPELGRELALAGALALRLATVTADLVVFGLAMGLSRRYSA